MFGKIFASYIVLSGVGLVVDGLLSVSVWNRNPGPLEAVWFSSVLAVLVSVILVHIWRD